MAFGDTYATVEDFATFIQQDLSAEEAATADMLLDAASRAVENFTGRQFNKATTASARRFRAVDPERLPVDDFHTTTDLEVSVDGTPWDIADVDPRPWDGVYQGQTGWPYFDLLTVNRVWPASRRANVTVTAQWGWAAVPEGITQATLEVARVAFSAGGGSGIVRSRSIDGAGSVTYEVPKLGTEANTPPELVKAAPYRRVRFGVG